MRLEIKNTSNNDYSTCIDRDGDLQNYIKQLKYRPMADDLKYKNDS